MIGFLDLLDLFQHFSVVPDKSDSDVMGVSAVLALCGWRAGEQEDVLEDLYGTRHVGLWNFVSLLEEEDRRETQRIMREFSEPIGEKDREEGAAEDREEGVSENREEDEETSNNSNAEEVKEVVDEDSLPNKSLNKPYFHPQTEHMSWNPILTEEGGQLGWQIVLDTLNKNHGMEKQVTSPNRHRQPLASLQRVRSLLNQW